MEIQKEETIEIVGTQYEGRAANHQPQFLKNLTLKHQKDNPHDSNAVLILTGDGKELGFLPKGYASIYAPSIDSGRYIFAVDVVKSEQDPERPILIVKITSELKNHSEEDVERNITALIQNIVNSCVQLKTKYLRFIYTETFNTEELLLTLNRVRLAERLCSVSADVIDSNSLKRISVSPAPLTKDVLIGELLSVLNNVRLLKINNIEKVPENPAFLNKNTFTEKLNELKADVNDILKKIQKSYNESIDIDDEEEYHRVQSKIRESRKKFRLYDNVLTSLLDTVQNYVDIKLQAGQSAKPESEQKKETVTAVLPKPQNDSLPNLTEQAFLNWLMIEDDLSEYIAEQYVSHIHKIEKLYQNIFGVRRNIFGVTSGENVKSLIESLIERREYTDVDNRSYRMLSISLSKFAQFAGIYVSELESTSINKNYQSYDRTKSPVIKIVDFNNPEDCKYCKPCSLIFNDIKYSAKTWKELYNKFLILLYNDSNYNQILKNLNGKSLYNRKNHMDFADKTLKHQLRNPIRVSDNFFAEVNLSTQDILRRIKCVKELCSVDDKCIIIEYYAFEKDDENFSQDISDETAVESVPEKAENNVPTPERFTPGTAYTSNPRQPNTETVPKKVENNAPAPKRFTPNTTSEFNLKNALIEIFLSDAPEITKYREYRNGISLKNLRKLIEQYYKKSIGLFEFSKMLMLDKAFCSVNKGFYVLNEALISQSKKEPEKSVSFEILNENKKITIESIINIIRENKDNIQYEYGFGTYEVKTLLCQKGFTDVSEEEIETLMSESPKLREVEEGYYLLSDEKEEIKIVENVPEKSEEINTEKGNIILKLNGKFVTAYDYSDALNKICEFAINCKPFKMARIELQTIRLHGNSVFYRNVVPVNGCNKLSDGLQVISVGTLSDLQEITSQIKKYCQIDDNMISIINR